MCAGDDSERANVMSLVRMTQILFTTAPNVATCLTAALSAGLGRHNYEGYNNLTMEQLGFDPGHHLASCRCPGLLRSKVTSVFVNVWS